MRQVSRQALGLGDIFMIDILRLSRSHTRKSDLLVSGALLISFVYIVIDFCHERLCCLKEAVATFQDFHGRLLLVSSCVASHDCCGLACTATMVPREDFLATSGILHHELRVIRSWTWRSKLLNRVVLTVNFSLRSH